MNRRLKEFIPEIRDYYTITSEGKIYSDNSGEMRTRNKKNTTYQLVNLVMEDGKKKTFKIHRLVMMAFQPVVDMEKLEVNHIDGDKRNNLLENLEWCTASENQLHAFLIGLQKPRRGEKSNFSKLNEQDIQLIFELRKSGYTQKKISEVVGCSRSNISYILNGKTWQIESSTTIPSGSREQVIGSRNGKLLTGKAEDEDIV